MERKGRFPMALTVILGGADSGSIAHLLHTILDARPRVRAAVITSAGARSGGREFPMPEEGPAALLEQLERARCTHAVLLPDGDMLARCGGLHPAVTALAAPTPGAEELLRRSDMVVLDLDERELRRSAEQVSERVFTYSEGRTQADLVARELRLAPGQTEFEAVTVGRIQRFHLPVPGGWALYHALCAVACGLCLGVELADMAGALRCVRPLPGQLEVLAIPAAYTVVLDGADTPRALERLLACTREFTAGSLTCVLRCPEERAQERDLRGVAGQMADRVFCDHGGRGARDRSRPERERQRAVFRALEHAGPGDVIVLAGYRPAAAETADERELVRAYIRHRQTRRRRACAL